MSFDLEFDDDLAQRRLQRLEHRYRRAQNVLAGSRTAYGYLRERPDATATQLHQALLQVERAQRALADLQFDMDVNIASPRGVDNDYWNYFAR